MFGQNNQPEVKPSVYFRFSKKRILSVILLLFLLAAIPLTISLVKQTQNIRQEASEPLSDSTIMLAINNHDYSLGEIKKIASEQYDSSSVDTQTLKIAQDILIERKILDTAATENNISVLPDEQKLLVDSTQLKETEAYYEVLKNKITKLKVRFIKAVSIGYWVPPSDERADYETSDQQKIETQIAEGGPAIDKAEQGLKAGQSPITLAESILQSSNNLSDVLSLNGYIFATLKTEDKQTISGPSLYEYNDSNFDVATRDKLFAADVSEGDVVRIPPTPDSGGESIFKITEKKNESGEGSYESWLKKQKESIVEIKRVL